MVLIICLYFIFYFMKFFLDCKSVIYFKISTFKNKRNEVKEFLQSIVIPLKNSLHFHNFKQFIRSSFIIILGTIVVILSIALLVMYLILKFPVVFLNRIICTEKNTGFEFLRYIILPFILGIFFVKYMVNSSIHETSFNVIIDFYTRITELQLLFWVLLLFLPIIAFCNLFMFKTKNMPLYYKEIFKYLYKWIQLAMFILIYITVIGTYFLLLDEIKGRNNSFDSYTIIPIFIKSCITSSNIIIKLLTVVNKDKVKNELKLKPKRFPYRNMRK